MVGREFGGGGREEVVMGDGVIALLRGGEGRRRRGKESRCVRLTNERKHAGRWRGRERKGAV